VAATGMIDSAFDVLSTNGAPSNRMMFANASNSEWRPFVSNLRVNMSRGNVRIDA